jgi:methionyl aminopeptidase
MAQTKDGIKLKNSKDVELLREGGKILAMVLEKLVDAVKPGVSTRELNDFAEKLIRESGAKPAFKGYGQPPFPAALCTSVNECVVHGIPSSYKLKEGDIIGLDCGVIYKDRFTDAAISVPVGDISAQAKKLLQSANNALSQSIAVIKPGAAIGDIGFATKKSAEADGFNVVRDLSGHGVGFQVHEPPSIPNFGKPGNGIVLEPGMVLAIEPMLTAGNWHLETAANGWDACTTDKSLTAHFERTIVVTENGFEDLTPWKINLSTRNLLTF